MLKVLNDHELTTIAFHIDTYQYMNEINLGIWAHEYNRVVQYNSIDSKTIYFSFIAGCTNLNVPMAHGSSHRPRRCVECKCDNGRISCTRQDPIHDCPKLNCPIEDQIHEEGECCKVCKGMLLLNA